MRNPFKNLPLNTKQSYVRGVSKAGTEIYIPVDTRDDKKLDEEKEALQEYLDAHVIATLPPEPSSPSPMRA